MKRIIIIGAGPAGITAAYELLKQSKDFEVTILEQSRAIGGISRTVQYNKNRMDIGGHRFFSKDERVNKWWQEIMPMQGAPSYDDIILKRERQLCPGGPDPEKEDIVMLKRHRVSRIYYKKKFFDYPVKMSAATIKNMGFLTTMQAGFSYLASCMHKLPETSLENFYINRFGKKLYSMFFEGYTEKLWGRSPSQISADWGAQRVKGLSIKAVLKDMLIKNKNAEVETSLIEEFSYPKYGPGQLWETAADKISSLGGNILMGCKVVGIDNNNGLIHSVRYISEDEGGTEKTIEADFVISSMPICELIEAIGTLPEKISTYARNLPYRDFVTVGLLLNKLNLVNKTGLKTLNNIVPDCWIYVQDTGVQLGRIQIFNNWSPYLVEKPEEYVWIGLEYFESEGTDMWNKSEAEWIDFVAGEIISMGLISSKKEILDYHLEKVPKAYPAYFDSYSHMKDIITELDKYSNLYCIGRNGQHRYNNMDHSMATAFEAVDLILKNKKDKTDLWNVNTEKTYHEEKK